METRFDVIGKSYEQALKLFPNVRTDAQEILRLLDIQGNETVLEISCGSGFLSMRIAGLLKSGRLIVQDISPVMANFLKGKIADKNVANITFYLTGDMALPELEDSSIDKAVCLGGFHHIEEPVKLFRAVRRVLKSGGIFVVGDFADNSLVQKYFDERVNQVSSTGHQGLFLSESQMVNFGRFAKLRAALVQRKLVPFIFQSERDIGIFYQLVHALEQDVNETQNDVARYMGVWKIAEHFVVPMDYVFAVYEKREDQ